MNLLGSHVFEYFALERVVEGPQDGVSRGGGEGGMRGARGISCIHSTEYLEGQLKGVGDGPWQKERVLNGDASAGACAWLGVIMCAWQGNKNTRREGRGEREEREKLPGLGN